MKKLAYFSILLLCLSGCRQQPDRNEAGREYVCDTLITVTTPRNQVTDADLDWILAAKSMIESEHSAYGDNVFLSTTFFVRSLLAEQTSERYFLGDGHTVSMTGMAPTLLRLLHTHGSMLHSAYHTAEDFRFNPLCRQLEQLADTYRAQHKGAGQLAEETERIMEQQIGPMPVSVFMLGCQYTPLEFGRSMCGNNEYISITSFTHHPFGHQFVLEVPQNRYHDTFVNVPLDTLFQITASALQQGHTVCWEGQLDKKTSHAIDRNVTQTLRQEAFDRFETVLNKALLLVGTAHDKTGGHYFIAKDFTTGGLVYLSDNYFKMKTVAITLAAACVPLSVQQPQHNESDIFILPDSI